MVKYLNGERGEDFEEDFGGHVEMAEKVLFNKLVEYIRQKNPLVLFREIDKKKDGKIDKAEWIWGMQSIVNSKCSDSMLSFIFTRMDLGDDHLGAVDKDECLTYKEWITTMRYYMKNEYAGIHPRSHPGVYRPESKLHTVSRPDKCDIVRKTEQTPERRSDAPKNLYDTTNPEECGGDLYTAEKKLFRKLINYSVRSNVPNVFKDIDKKGDFKLDPEEWLYGMQELIKSTLSDQTLLKIFDQMDLGEDHLGRVDSDRTLTYKEFATRMDFWKLRAWEGICPPYERPPEPVMERFDEPAGLNDAPTPAVGTYYIDGETTPRNCHTFQKGRNVLAPGKIGSTWHPEHSWKTMPTPPKQRFRKYSKKLVRTGVDEGGVSVTPEVEDYDGDLLKAEERVLSRLQQALKQNNFQSLFWRLNKTRDGYLTKSEFVEGLRSICFSQASDAMLERIFKRIGVDARKRGALTYKELQGCLRKHSGTCRPHEWHQRSQTSRHDYRHKPPPVGTGLQAGTDSYLPPCYYTPRPPNRANVLTTGSGTMLRGATHHAI